MAPECEGGVGVGATNARDPKGGCLDWRKGHLGTGGKPKSLSLTQTS